MLVTLLDSNLCHAYCSSFIPPLTAETVIGRPVWEYVGPEDVDRVKTMVSRCLAIGEPQKYWVQTVISGVDYLWRCRAERVRVGPSYGVIIVSYLLPAAARSLTDLDVQIIAMLSAGKTQKQIAAALNTSQSVVSRRESELRRGLGIATIGELWHLRLALE